MSAPNRPGRRNQVIKTRIGYYASAIGIILNMVAVAGLFALDLFGTPFGVLVLASMFFVGLVFPYVIDSVAWRVISRRKK